MGIAVSSITQELQTLAKNKKDSIVLIDSEKSHTAKDIWEKSLSLAFGLKSKGFNPKDKVLLLFEPGVDFVVCIYALLLLDATIVLLDPEMGPKNFNAKIDQIKPDYAFVDSRLLLLSNYPKLKKFIDIFKKDIPSFQLPKDCSIISVGKKMWFGPKNISLIDLMLPYEPMELAMRENHGQLLVFTSGTLSVPKGVLHSSESLGFSIQHLSKLLQETNGKIVGTYLPHFMLIGIATGLTVKTFPKNWSAKRKLYWFEKEKIELFFGPPSEVLGMVRECENSNKNFPSTFKHLLLGSAPVHRSFLLRLLKVLKPHVKVTCIYGMTEHLFLSVADGREKAIRECQGDWLGYIHKDVEIKINDDQEISVKSNQLFSKYYHEESSPEWHATGDLGEKLADGSLTLLGRKKDMIIRRDFNLYPAHYEGIVTQIPEVNDAVFLGIFSKKMQDEIVFLVVDAENISLAQLEKKIEKGEFGIDKEALPDYIVFMPIPYTGRQHKPDRSSLRAELAKTYACEL